MATFSDGATHTINQSYADGEQIIIDSGSTVVIDADTFVPTNKWGQIAATTNGFLRLVNTGTKMLVFEFNSKDDNLRIEGNSLMTTRGSFIEVATGDGTAGQTIDFSSVGSNNVALDEVTCIWIEETPGGKKWPFHTLGDPANDYISLPILGTAGQAGIGTGGSYGGSGSTIDTGRHFNFNRTTRVATFGNGTYGFKIPNGCKAYINNIQIVSEYVNTRSARSTFDLSVSGSLDFQHCDIGSSMYVSLQNTTDVTFNYVSVCGYMQSRDSYGHLKLENFVFSGDTRDIQEYYPRLDIETVQGTWEGNNLYIDSYLNVSSNRTMADIGGDGCSSLKNVWIALNWKNGTSRHYPLVLSYFKDAIIENVYVIGGNVNVNHTQNSIYKNIKIRATPFDPQPNVALASWSNGMYLSQFGGINSNSKFIDFVQDGPLPFQSGGININTTSSNIELYGYYVNSNWNGGNIGNSGLNDYGDNTTIKNSQILGYFASYSISRQADAVGGTYDNIEGSRRSNIVRECDTNMIPSGSMAEYLLGSPSINKGISLIRKTDVGANVGAIGIPSVKGGSKAIVEYEGGAFFSQINYTYLESIGDSYSITSVKPMKGMTGFYNGNSYFATSGLNPEEVEMSFKMSKAGDELPSTWTIITTSGTSANQNIYTQMQNAFNALTNYDSNKGLNFAFKVKNISDAGNLRGFLAFNFACEIDTAYTASDASIAFEGGDATEKYEVIKASDDSVMYTFTGTGTHEFSLGSNYGVDVYFKRYKYVNGAYVLLVNTQYTSQSLDYGFNGSIKLYTGNEVQTASTDPATIWNYGTRTTTEGFTSSDRTQLNKGLTTGKFLALK